MIGNQGHYLKEMDFEQITRGHPNTLERGFEDVDDCVHMLPCYQLKVITYHNKLNTYVGFS